MFDKTIVFPTKPYGDSYSAVTVTEKRAPTDDSVRLLKEMEEKARQKIIDSFTVNDTHFDCKIFQENDMLTRENRFVVIYSMNGKRRTVEVRVEESAIQNTYKKIISAVAYDIAGAILSDAFEGKLR